MGGPRLVAVVGATCSGKTSLAVALGESLGGELINADSRQAIAEVSVGVCKPTAQELRGIPCHGLDWRHLGEPFTAADFVGRARSCLAEVWRRRRLPILVGGSGMYMRALLEGFDFGGTGVPGPVPRSPAGEESTPSLQAQALLAVSPEWAARVDLNNPRRVKRALEMARAGRDATRTRPGWAAVRLGCRVEREVLKCRIRTRAEALIGPSLQAEVAGLLERGYAPATVASCAIGYSEALAWRTGECSRQEATDRLAGRTWRYARAQLTWLRSEPDVVWMDGSEDAQGMLTVCRSALEARWQQESV